MAIRNLKPSHAVAQNFEIFSGPLLDIKSNSSQAVMQYNPTVYITYIHLLSTRLQPLYSSPDVKEEAQWTVFPSWNKR